MNPKYIERVVKDFLEVSDRLTRLSETDLQGQEVSQVAATLVLAARLEAVEDALISGFPIAGEGI